MNTQSRKIAILSMTPGNVVFQHIPEGQLVSMSRYVFQQFLVSGAYEVVNQIEPEVNLKTLNHDEYKSQNFEIQTT